MWIAREWNLFHLKTIQICWENPGQFNQVSARSALVTSPRPLKTSKKSLSLDGTLLLAERDGLSITCFSWDIGLVYQQKIACAMIIEPNPMGSRFLQSKDQPHGEAEGFQMMSKHVNITPAAHEASKGLSPPSLCTTAM